MNNDRDDKDNKKDKKGSDQKHPGVFTPEPPQVMNPSEHPKKNTDDSKSSKSKTKEKKKDK